MMEQDTEWISISTMARMIGKSEQTVRNKIRKGLYETMTFSRGKMKGILVRKPKCDE